MNVRRGRRRNRPKKEVKGTVLLLNLVISSLDQCWSFIITREHFDYRLYRLASYFPRHKLIESRTTMKWMLPRYGCPNKTIFHPHNLPLNPLPLLQLNFIVYTPTPITLKNFFSWFPSHNIEQLRQWLPWWKDIFSKTCFF